MKKSLIICDRLMYGILLALIFFLPYSLMLIAVCQGTMSLTWVVNRVLLFKISPRQGFFQGLNVTPGSMFWPVLALALLIALTIPFSHCPALSLKKLGTRFLFQIVLMVVVIQVVNNRKRLYGVLAVLMFMVLCVSLEALCQSVGAQGSLYRVALIFGRVSGPMHHPNDLGTLLVTILPVALVLVINSRTWFTSLFRWLRFSSDGLLPWCTGAIAAVFLILAVALGLTASRGAWVAFVASMLALSFCLKRRKVFIFMALMLVLFFWTFGMYCLNKRVDLYSAPTSQGSVMRLFTDSNGRDFYWDTAMGVIKKNPWFGCGYNAYIQTLKDLKVGHSEYPHNSLLHITAELGIVGMLFFLWLLAALYFQGRKVICHLTGAEDLRVLACGISCGILAWLIHSLLDTPWSSLQLSLLLWLFIGILFSLKGVLSHQSGERSCHYH